MPEAPSARLGIVTPSDTGDSVRVAPDVFQAIRDTLDPKVVIFDQGATLPVSTPASPGIAGRFYKTPTGLFYDYGTGWWKIELSASALVGELRPYCGATEPGDVGGGVVWAFADGRLTLTAQFPALYAAIGHTYNRDITGTPTDPGGGAFRIPDYRGRVPVGAEIMTTAWGVATPQRIPNHSSVVGSVGGVELDVLQTHGHGVTVADHTHPAGSLTAADHTHTFVTAGPNTTSNVTNTGANTQMPSTTHIHSGTTAGSGALGIAGSTAAGGGQTVTSAAPGSSTPADNLQPYQSCYYIVRLS